MPSWDRKGGKKTVTIPNGDVILDMNGEWDVVGENYGVWSEVGADQDVFKITQEGSSFETIRMRGNNNMPAGTAETRGGLDKKGFKGVSIISSFGPVDAEGRISEDGNKIVIDAHNKARVTLTRK
jgi:hypothetical protein